MFTKKLFIFLGLSFFSYFFLQAEEKKLKDEIFDDFESGSYSDNWETIKGIFQSKPLKRSNVKPGYKPNILKEAGEYFVMSFQDQRDKATGKMISKNFVIKHKFINFLIWGGSKNVGMRLLVDGKEVANAAGENSVEIIEDYFSVSKYKGKNAVLEIFDNNTGGWGHIGVDKIIFSDSIGGCEE